MWRGNESLEACIGTIGRLSPPPFAALLEDHARDRRPEIRNQVAVALEQLGAASAVKTVRSALAKEKDPRIEKNWIRALGATGYADKSARKALLKLATREKDDVLRRNAIFALGYLLIDESTRKALIDRFESEDPLDRQAAACAMALSRNGVFVETLRAAPGDATDDDTRAVARRALAILRGAPLHTIEADVKRLCEDLLPRERVFFQVLPR